VLKLLNFYINAWSILPWGFKSTELIYLAVLLLVLAFIAYAMRVRSIVSIGILSAKWLAAIFFVLAALMLLSHGRILLQA